jgi:hypothetical protein
VNYSELAVDFSIITGLIRLESLDFNKKAARLIIDRSGSSQFDNKNAIYNNKLSIFDNKLKEIDNKCGVMRSVKVNFI